MAAIVRNWAGVERSFDLPLGRVFDLEESCGKVGIGAIYARLSSHQFFAADVYHTIKQGLIGGGMSDVDAKRLLDQRFGVVPLVESVELAIDVLVGLMEGVTPREAETGGNPATPLDTGKILHSFVQAGIAPDAVRNMRYADFLNILNAVGSKGDTAPSAEEFEDMVARMVKE